MPYSGRRAAGVHLGKRQHVMHHHANAKGHGLPAVEVSVQRRLCLLRPGDRLQLRFEQVITLPLEVENDRLLHLWFEAKLVAVLGAEDGLPVRLVPRDVDEGSVELRLDHQHPLAEAADLAGIPDRLVQLLRLGQYGVRILHCPSRFLELREARRFLPSF